MDMNKYNELLKVNEIEETEVQESKSNDTISTIVGWGVITLSAIGAITTARYIGKKVKSRKEYKAQQYNRDFEQRVISDMIREGKTEEEIKMVINTLRKINEEI